MAKVTMYGTAYCPFCIRARSLLEEQGVVYNYVAVDGNAELREEMQRLSGRHTVPQIFIEDRPIGGCDELIQLHHSGELGRLLA